MPKRQRVTLIIDEDEPGPVLKRLARAAGAACSSVAIDPVQTSSDGEARRMAPRDDKEFAAMKAALMMYEEELRNEDDAKNRVAAIGRVLDRVGARR